MYGYVSPRDGDCNDQFEQLCRGAKDSAAVKGRVLILKEATPEKAGTINWGGLIVVEFSDSGAVARRKTSRWMAANALPWVMSAVWPPTGKEGR